MATEISRTFNLQAGAVISQVKDALGNVSLHTIYVSGPNGVTDVNAAVAQILTQTDAAAAAIHAAFTAAGWTPSGS
jgi:hypothetical protein